MEEESSYILVSIQTAYNEWSESYDTDRNLTRDLDEKVTRETLSGRKYRCILELGCGTGKNTGFLAELSEKVWAFDFSEGMIDRAKKKVAATNVTFTAADLGCTWPFQDQAADLVVSNLVLEHICELPFIFSEAARSLTAGGQFFISELHPYRQYQGAVANFKRQEETTDIPAFVHHVSDFMGAANKNGLALESFQEWWHAEDEHKLPRLVSFLFRKTEASGLAETRFT